MAGAEVAGGRYIHKDISTCLEVERECIKYTCACLFLGWNGMGTRLVLRTSQKHVRGTGSRKY